MEVVTRSRVEEDLRALGLRSGDAVEVHSSLRSLGWVQGGPKTVIEALINAVGEKGAIVMSAYPVSPPLPLTETELARGLTYKVRLLAEDSEERTGMGLVADTFKRRRDVICGSELHRVCAWGHEAERHSLGYQHLLDVDGWALLLGVGIFRCSSLHQAEDPLVLPEEIAEVYAIPEDVARDYPADTWAIGYATTELYPWAQVWAEALRRGIVHRGRVGQAECKLFRAQAMVSLYRELQRGDLFALFGLERPPG